MSKELKEFIDKHNFNDEFSRVINHHQLEKFIYSLSNKKFNIDILGSSVEGRNIYSIEFGEGNTKVLLWSQMHGDEPTATLALIDLLSYLDEAPEELEEFNKKLKVKIIPMLNPDGAERMTRENALGIDINRDAVKLVSPESRILMNELINFQPEFAFNLHDQDIRWKVGECRTPASLSLLAPPPNYTKDITPARMKAIQLVSELFFELRKIIPDSIAKYSDEHEPRSFGDTAAKMNISTILIEAGRVKDDYEKSFLRKLNFALFLYSLHSIAADAYSKYDDNIYKEIPFNNGNYFDLIIRNVQFISGQEKYKLDIGIDREYKFIPEAGCEELSSTITSVGDLSNTFGLEEFIATDLELKPPKVYESKLPDDYERLWELIEGGHLIFFHDANVEFKNFPLTTTPNKSFEFKLLPGQPADFILEGKEKIFVINGFLIRCKEDLSKIKREIKKPQL